MAARETILDAFDRCIDRINQGETVDTVLQDYREFANDLRPMLEAGLLLPRARFPVEVVENVEQTLEPLIRETISTVFRGGLAGTTWLLLLVLLGLVVGVVLLLVSRSGQPPQPTLTAPPSAAPLIAPSVTPEPTLTLTLTPLPTFTLTLTPSPSLTHTSTLTTPSVTPSPVTSVIVIQGAVGSINGNTITIFNQTIQLDPADPRLPVLRPNDIVRVEGMREGGIIRVTTLTFVNVVVVTQGNSVWRDDSCAMPPPAWAQASAADWTQRCVSGGGYGGGGAGGDDDGGGGAAAPPPLTGGDDNDDDGGDDFDD